VNLTQRISLIWRRFSPLEERLLAAVRETLPPETIDAFDAQVAAITLIQRHPHWTGIAFYRRRFGKVDWIGIPMFPRVSEFPLAEVRFSVAHRRYKATLTSIGGHIFDFSVTPSPKSVAFAEWDASPTSKLLSDPLAADAARPPETIPPVWSEFMAQPKSFTRDWDLYDASTARRLTLDEGEFVILAERAGDEFLLHRIEPVATTLFYLESHDATPEPLDRPVADVFRTA
jgi:hypothetical protein